MARKGREGTTQKDEVREERIIDEIVVDAYDEEERAIGWFTYLGDALGFPFNAKCVREMAVSPLKKGEALTVQGMADFEVCRHGMVVMIEWNKRSFGVPLEQLLPVEVDEDTLEAVMDWHYWKDQAYEF